MRDREAIEHCCGRLTALKADSGATGALDRGISRDAVAGGPTGHRDVLAFEIDVL
jgi:hypothetical protein